MSPGEALSQVLGENVLLRSLLREQRKLQRGLRHTSGRLRSFLASVPGVIYSFNPNGKLDYVSPAIKALLGHPDTWYMADAGRYLDQVHPDDLGRVYHWRLHLLYDKGPGESELRYRMVRADGRQVEVVDRVSVVYDRGALARIDGIIVPVQPGSAAGSSASQLRQRLAEVLSTQPKNRLKPRTSA